MANYFDQYDTPAATVQNHFDQYDAAVPVTAQEQDVIQRTNNSQIESPASFGLVDIPLEPIKAILNVPASWPRNIGENIVEASDQIPLTKDMSMMDVARLSMARNFASASGMEMKKAADGSFISATANETPKMPSLFGMAGIMVSAEKDALLSLFSDTKAPEVLSSIGNEMITDNKAAIDALGLNPKGGGNFGYDVGGALGQIGMIFMLKTPAAAQVYFTALINSDTYTQAKETDTNAGLPPDPEKWARIAAENAYGQGLLFALGGKVFQASSIESTALRSFLNKTAGLTAMGAGQAAIDTGVLNAESIRHDTPEEAISNIAYQTFVMMVAGMVPAAIHTKIERMGKEAGLPPEKIEQLSDNLLSAKNEMIDHAAILMGKEAEGVTNDAPARAETLETVNQIMADQKSLEEAKAAGETTDPKMAARLILESPKYDEAAKAAVQELEPGFTMEDLQNAVKPQDVLTAENAAAMMTEKPKENIYAPIDEKISTMNEDQARMRLNSLDKKEQAGIITPKEFYEREQLQSRKNQSTKSTNKEDVKLAESLALEEKHNTKLQEGLARWKEMTSSVRENTSLTKKQIKETQTQLLDFINQSQLEAADKAKFLATIKNTQTAKELVNNIDEIEARINNLIDAQKRRETFRKIKKVLAKTKPTKQSGKPVGKFADADLQGIMDILRADTKLTQEQAQAKLEKNLSEDPTVESALENSLLAIMAGHEGTTIEHMLETLDTISALIEGGKARKLKNLAERKERITETKEQVVDGITQGRDIEDISKINLKDRFIKAFNVVRSAESGLNNGWFDTLDILLGKTTAGRLAREKLSNPVHQAIQKEAGMVINLGNDFVGFAKDIFGLKKNSSLRKKFIKDEKLINLGKFSRDGQDQPEGTPPGKEIPWELSVAQGRKLWMELQDPKLRKTLVSKNGNGITSEMEAMLDPEKNDFLTPQDIEFAKAQMKFYKEIYPKIDDIYAAIYGIHLPKNPFYSPIRRVHKEKIGDSNEFLQDLKSRQSAAPSSVKSRVETNAKILEQSDITALLKHIAEASHFISMAETARDLNSVFSDPAVRQTIDATWGGGMLENIDGYIGDFTAGHIQRAEKWMGLVDAFNSNFAKAVLGAKANMIPKQMSSMFAYATEIPTNHFMMGIADFSKNPEAAIRILSKSDLMKKRGSSQDVDIAKGAQQQAGKLFGQRQSLDEFLLSPIKLGDRGAIYAGGWAIYKYNRDILGKTHEQSIAEFERVTADVAQSTDLDKLSRFQASRNPFMRTLGMFMTAPNSYYRLEKRAIRQAFRGEISKADAAKKLIILHFLLPALFQYIANGFHWDDEDEMRSAALGSLNGFMILGSVLESSIAAAQGIYYPERRLNFIAGAEDLFNAGAKSYRKGEIAFSNILDALGLLTGLPVKTIENIGGGIEDFSKGQTLIGAKRISGYTEKTAKKNSKPKKQSSVQTP